MNINFKLFFALGIPFGIVMGLTAAQKYDAVSSIIYGLLSGLAFGLYAGHSIKKKDP